MRVTLNNITAAAMLAPEARGSVADRTKSLVETLSELPVRLGLPTHLRDVGISESDITMLADDAMKQTRMLINNPREFSHDDAMAIDRNSL